MRRGGSSLVTFFRPIGNRIKADNFPTTALLANTKVRSDALESRLRESSGDEAVRRLRDDLLSGLEYSDAVEMVEREYDVETSLAGMSRFYKSVCAPWRNAQMKQTAALAIALTEDINAADFDKANRILLTENTFDLMNDRSADPKERAAMVKHLLTAIRDEQNYEKFQASLVSKTEAGFNALFAEIEGNEKAEKIFAELREAVAGK